MKTFGLLAFAAFLLIGAADAATGFQTDSLILYQSGEELSARVPGAHDLARYIQEIQKVCAKDLASEATPETLYIVMALKPGKKSRAWFVSSTRQDLKELDPLKKLLEAVPVIDVIKGPVAFAICAKIAGGDGKNRPGAGPPIPKSWRDAAKGAKTPLRMPDGYLGLIWPDSGEGR